ncbi:CCA tRNA nucleotidyltransferase [Thermococcus sp. M39]|uniref:CCA tRNA nucleotidyltransferase n=1 Tax=unclassified Thermococcus TaxID=2627626 RepID=UPI00143C9E7F|nr:MULTISPECIES: CCA tRNA nucleotidyltransferase [unclassified Thermococcus]NJE07010.1 CCA tRNA nucleotidyltransferase [Thermococcus sp. M39]NJE12910.1 CCA tRNA nucleotidyltransferase [Thermococcus sp. LS2]
MELSELLNQVLKEIKPSEEERELVEKVKGEVESIAKETIAAFGYDVEPYFVGSLAKDTYLAGDHDIDLFLAFPLEIPLEGLRKEGLELAKAIGEKLGKYEVAYAEHPYVRAFYRGFKVDLVPCYNVRDWREVRTAVDRSILHMKWVLKHLNSKNDEVRLLKKFFKGINVYGSEIYVKGFSGYLTELLIIKYGSFLKVLENHDFMLRQKIIDLEGWLKKEPEVAMKTVKREADADVPLIVIDPVDPRRNVASALSWEKFGIFYFKAKQFLEKPAREFFFLEQKKIGDYKKLLREKGTKLVTLLFEKPDLIDDLLLPQLEKSAKGFMKALELQGFRVFEAHWGYKDKAFIMLEVDRVERSRIEIKPGPEFFTERGLRFYSKNQKVWIRGKRLYSEKVVKESIVDVIRGLLEKNQVSLGKQVKEHIMQADILINFVPPELSDEAYLFLSREKWNLKD